MSTRAAQTGSTIIPGFRYRDAPAAIRWLREVFGFEERLVIANPDGTIAHAELTFAGGMVMLGSQKEDAPSVPTDGTYVVVPDADAMQARVEAAGVQVLVALHDTDYGSREFTVKDLEGRIWTLGTYDPWVGGEE